MLMCPAVDSKCGRSGQRIAARSFRLYTQTAPSSWTPRAHRLSQSLFTITNTTTTTTLHSPLSPITSTRPLSTDRSPSMERSRYSRSQLMDIAAQNNNRLPPSSAVLRMFMFGLQRDEETQNLFQNNMDALSRIREEEVAMLARLDSMARAVKRCERHHMHNLSLIGGVYQCFHVQTLKVLLTITVRSVSEAIHSITSAPNSGDEKTLLKHSAQLLDELDQAEISTEEQVAVVAVLMASQAHETKMGLESIIERLKDQNKALTQDLLETKSRVSKLEDLIRALTLQKSASPESPKKAHFIPVSTSDGQTIELSVPKGSSLVPLKDSRASSRSTTPTNFQTDPNAASETNDSPEKREAFVSQEKGHHGAASLIWTATPDSEKPLPPVPAAQAFSKSSTIKDHDLQAKEAPVPVASMPSNGPVQASPSKTTKKPSMALYSAPKPEARLENQLASQATPQAASSANSQPAPGSKRVKWKDSPLFQDAPTLATTGESKTSSVLRDDLQPQLTQCKREHGSKASNESGHVSASANAPTKAETGNKLTSFRNPESSKLLPEDATGPPEARGASLPKQSLTAEAMKEVKNREETNYVAKTRDKAGAATVQGATPSASTSFASQAPTAPSFAVAPTWAAPSNASRSPAFGYSTFKMTATSPTAEPNAPQTIAPFSLAPITPREDASAGSDPHKSSRGTSATSFIKRPAVKMVMPQNNVVSPSRTTKQVSETSKDPPPSPLPPSLTPTHQTIELKDGKVPSEFAKAVWSPAPLAAASTPTQTTLTPKPAMSPMAPAFQPSSPTKEQSPPKGVPSSLMAMLTPDQLFAFQAKVNATQAA